VLLIRKIRELLYEQGFTISGARNRLDGAEDRAETAAMSQASAQISQVATESANDFDFFSFKQHVREVIQLLRA
jgi:hypothetical protein